MEKKKEVFTCKLGISLSRDGNSPSDGLPELKSNKLFNHIFEFVPRKLWRNYYLLVDEPSASIFFKY